MRGVLLSLAVVGLIALAAPSRASAAYASGSPVVGAQPAHVVALQIPDKKIEITIGDRNSTAWYRNPVWIAIGVLAAVVILLLIVLIAKGGGGTTIVRD